MFNQINFIGIIAAAIISMIAGGLWYSVIFRRKWSALAGMPAVMTPEMKQAAKKSMTINFLATLVTAFVLERIMYNVPLVTLSLTVTLAVLIWLGFIAATNLNEYIFSAQKRPMGLYYINQSFQLVSVILMTVVLYFI